MTQRSAIEASSMKRDEARTASTEMMTKDGLILSHGFRLLASVSCLLSPVSCLLSSVSCLLASVSWLLAPGSWLLLYDPD